MWVPAWFRGEQDVTAGRWGKGDEPRWRWSAGVRVEQGAMVRGGEGTGKEKGCWGGAWGGLPGLPARPDAEPKGRVFAGAVWAHHEDPESAWPGSSSSSTTSQPGAPGLTFPLRKKTKQNKRQKSGICLAGVVRVGRVHPAFRTPPTRALSTPNSILETWRASHPFGKPVRHARPQGAGSLLGDPATR